MPGTADGTAADGFEASGRQPFGRTLAAGLAWLTASGLLVVLGLALVLLAYYLVARAVGVVPDDQNRVFQTGLAMYFRVLLWKALVPQLILVQILWPLLARMWPAVRASRLRMLAGLMLVGGLAYAVVAPLLLTVSFEGWPALQMQGAADQLGSAALIISGVSLAAWAPRALRARRR